MALRLHSVPAAQGLLWVRAGFHVLARRPLGMPSLLLAFSFGTLVLSLLLPLAGSLLSLMALPLLGLGFMVATRSALAGGPVHAGQLVEPLRHGRGRRKPLLQVCALYGTLTLLALLAAGLVVGDAWEAAATVVSDPNATPQQVVEAAREPRLVWGVGLQMLLVSLLSVPFWHAPALVLWGEQGVAQALFSSTLAVWRNKGAFAVYGALWLGLTLALALASSLVLGLLGAPQLATAAALPITLVCMTAFYATLHFTFIDSFRADVQPAPADTPAA